MAKRRNSTNGRATASVIRMATTAPSAAPMAPASGGAPGERIELINWGDKDNLPQESLRVVYDSGTAEACATRLAQFIGGAGFANEATANLRANDEQTLNDLLNEAKHYVGLGFGVAVVCRYNYGGTRGEVLIEPSDCLRREKQGRRRFVVNYGRAEGKAEANDNRVYLPYAALATPAEIAAEVAAAVNSPGGYWGHLLFSFEARPGRTQYPVPSYRAGIEDLETDAALARYDRKQARSGFFPDAIFTVVGNKFAGINDPSFEPALGQTEDDAPELESPHLTAVKDAIKALKGSESDSSVMVLAVDTKDEIPTVDFIDKGPNSKGLSDMRARVVNLVCRHMGVPPVLVGVAEAGVLGSNQQIVNSIKLFNLTVEPSRALIISPLAKLFPEVLDWAIKPLNPVDYIDPVVAAKMTDDEIRSFGGLPTLAPLEDSAAQNTAKALNVLSPLLATKAVEEMTSREIRAIINLEGSKAEAEVAEARAANPTPTPRP